MASTDRALPARADLQTIDTHGRHCEHSDIAMVLLQLNGELRWLEEPYRPRRARGIRDNDTGGLPEPIQSEIRERSHERY
jgi:4-hydroxyacetophenone monooxygenase